MAVGLGIPSATLLKQGMPNWFTNRMQSALQVVFCCLIYELIYVHACELIVVDSVSLRPREAQQWHLCLICGSETQEVIEYIKFSSSTSVFPDAIEFATAVGAMTGQFSRFQKSTPKAV